MLSSGIYAFIVNTAGAVSAASCCGGQRVKPSPQDGIAC